MSEKPEADEFEDEEPAEPVIGTEDVDLDQVTKDLDMAKRRGQKLGDPAWRRLETAARAEADRGAHTRRRRLRHR